LKVLKKGSKMQTALNFTIPNHEFKYAGNGIYKVKCNIEQGNFYTSVWRNGKIDWYICPCCGGRCKI